MFLVIVRPKIGTFFRPAQAGKRYLFRCFLIFRTLALPALQPGAQAREKGTYFGVFGGRSAQNRYFFPPGKKVPISMFLVIVRPKIGTFFRPAQAGKRYLFRCCWMSFGPKCVPFSAPLPTAPSPARKIPISVFLVIVAQNKYLFPPPCPALPLSLPACPPVPPEKGTYFGFWWSNPSLEKRYLFPPFCPALPHSLPACPPALRAQAR